MTQLTLMDMITGETKNILVEDFWMLDNSNILHIKEPGKEWYTLEAMIQEDDHTYVIF